MSSPMKMTSGSRNREHGIALMFSLIALLLLTAITTSLIMLSDTESTVNANYRSEEVAFFAAKSGVYEALDRMQQSNANSIAAQLPTTTGTVLYLINQGGLSASPTPWIVSTTSSPNPYMDDELCHQGLVISGWSNSTPAAPDVPCTSSTSLPSGSAWYTSTNSIFPWSGGKAALPYEWVRINWKVNNSEGYISGTGSSAAPATYSVNSTLPGSATTPACWNGASEILLSTPAGVTPAYTNCEDYQTCGIASPSVPTPVYLITALSVTSNGSRQMVQAEAALNPLTVTVPPTCGITDAFGFFAYGEGFSCSNPALIIGGNASVDGYNSANGPYSASNKQASLGNVGTNQGAIEQGTSTKVGGNVYVPIDASGSPPVVGPGVCPDDFSISGNPTWGGLKTITTPLPKPTINTPPDSSVADVTSGPIVPGTYRNLSVGSHGAVTLNAPGTYVFDCITLGSFGTVTTSPASKAVTIYLTGTGCATTPFTMNSHSELINTSGISANLQINYAGTGAITLEGGPSECAIINAPNAPVTLHGGSDFFGTIMANSIVDSGGVNLHFDVADNVIGGAPAATAAATATGSYKTLAFRSVPY